MHPLYYDSIVEAIGFKPSLSKVNYVAKKLFLSLPPKSTGLCVGDDGVRFHSRGAAVSDTGMNGWNDGKPSLCFPDLSGAPFLPLKFNN